MYFVLVISPPKSPNPTGDSLEMHVQLRTVAISPIWARRCEFNFQIPTNIRRSCATTTQQTPAALPCWRTTPGIHPQPTLGRGFSFGGIDSTVDLSSEFDLCSFLSLPTDIPGWPAAQKSWLIGSASCQGLRMVRSDFGALFFGLFLGEKLLRS